LDLGSELADAGGELGYGVREPEPTQDVRDASKTVRVVER
jgi:hypothetical protein